MLKRHAQIAINMLLQLSINSMIGNILTLLVVIGATHLEVVCIVMLKRLKEFISLKSGVKTLAVELLKNAQIVLRNARVEQHIIGLKLWGANLRFKEKESVKIAVLLKNNY